jgi:hypothetical protein
MAASAGQRGAPQHKTLPASKITLELCRVAKYLLAGKLLVRQSFEDDASMVCGS